MFSKLKAVSLLISLLLIAGCGDDSKKGVTDTHQNDSQSSAVDNNPDTQGVNSSNNPSTQGDQPSEQKPEQSDDPSDGNKPNSGETPCEGDKCEKPEQPCEGDKCEKPEQPCEGDKCEKPEQPCEGDKCEKPEQPCEGDECETPEPPCEGDACTTEPVITKCQSDEDCSEKEECVTINGEGQCISSDKVEHCFDKDRDGFYSAKSSEYNNECGFSDAFPSDPDDNNPLVYPGANEICDSRDNNGDGCVDGTCPKDADCKKDTLLCERIVFPCWGAGDYRNYDNSVCSAAALGVQICEDNKLTHGILVDGKIVKDSNPEGRCPIGVNEIPNYAPQDSDGIDRNCDGKIDND
ncbi:MAG: hypothetical protein IJM59_12300 [Proteobacteria bacterium]|nr:hypothetical protein [Pseudomonadota bacterium]